MAQGSPSYNEAIQKLAEKRAPDSNMPNKKYDNRRFKPTARQQAEMKGRYVNKAGGVEALRGAKD